MIKQYIDDYGPWVTRLLIIAGLCANLWLGVNFVRKAEFDEYRAAQTTRETERQVTDASRNRELSETLQGIQITLARVDEKLKNDDRQDRQLSDHESRIRANERALAELQGRGH